MKKLIIILISTLCFSTLAVPVGDAKVMIKIQKFDKQWIYAKGFGAKFRIPRKTIKDSHLVVGSKREVALSPSEFREMQRQIYAHKFIKNKKKKRKPTSR